MSEAADFALRTFGTSEPAGPRTRLRAGLLAVELADGALRRVHWNGVELLRGLECLVRDAEWKTEPFVDVAESLTEQAGQFVCERRFSLMGGALAGVVSFTGEATGTLLARMEIAVRREVTVNRIGFVVLHPAHLAGTSGEVEHPDGTREPFRFPELVAPAQPVRDIAALAFTFERVSSRTAFAGDVWEMEDQRNWTDASFKTYSRPLDLPRPYMLMAGTTLTQSVRVDFHGAGPKHPTDGRRPCRINGATQPFPEVALAVENGWMPERHELDLLVASGIRRLQARVDARDGTDVLARVSACAAALRAAVDLEVLLDDDADASAAVATLRRSMDELELAPEHLIGLPRAYLESFQPNGRWPSGLTPERVAGLLSHAFPESRVGGGALTNFTEFNRCPPNATTCDYVSHGITAIVHAADDRSVMETLQALPQVFATGMAIGGGCSYRLGLAAIGMRTNPYGSACADNHKQVRRPMAHADPRQRGLFAAAYAIGVLAAAHRAGIESLALAAPVGPFGIVHRRAPWPQPPFDDDPSLRLYPLFHVLRAAARGRRAPALELSGLPPDMTGLGFIVRSKPFLLLANTSDEPRTTEFAAEMRARILDGASFPDAARDAHWLDVAPIRTGCAVTLPPYAVAFVEAGASG
ncbi:MAG: hypothetical protein JOY70_06065 [Acidisphaera sp.]|nr:hypothetical protein [Acidisphaera sp.]